MHPLDALGSPVRRDILVVLRDHPRASAGAQVRATTTRVTVLERGAQGAG